MILAISVDPPPIIVASARTSRKGLSETPPILNPSAPLNTVASATEPSAPSRRVEWGRPRLSTRRPESFQMPLH